MVKLKHQVLYVPLFISTFFSGAGGLHAGLDQQSLTLIEALELCHERSPKLKSSRSALSVSEAKRAATFGNFFPEVTLKSALDQAIKSGSSPSMSTCLKASGPLVKLPNNYEYKSTQVDHEIAQATLFSTTQDLFLELSKEYYGALKKDYEQRIAEQALMQLQRKVREDPSDRGAKSAYYKKLGEQQKIAHALESHLHKIAHLTQADHEIDLEHLLGGRDSPEILTFEDLKNFSFYCEFAVDEDPTRFSRGWLLDRVREPLVLRGQKSSSSCLKAFLTYEKSKSQYNKVYASYYPTLSASLEAKTNAGESHPLEGPLSWKGHLELSWTLFKGGNSGVSLASVAIARHEMAEKKALWLEACSKVDQEVCVALSKLEELYLSWLSSKLELACARAAFIDLGRDSTRRKETKSDPSLFIPSCKELEGMLGRVDLFEERVYLETRGHSYDPWKEDGLSFPFKEGSVEFRDALNAFISAQKSHLVTSYDLRIGYLELAKLVGVDLLQLLKEPASEHLWRSSELVF